MKSTTLVATLLTGVTALKVVKFDIQGTRNSASRLSKRATVNGVLDNQGNQYNINLTIGTPPQSFSLQVDTGSSDLWVNTADSAFCSGPDSDCTGGLYDSSASSTYQDYKPGAFLIGYADNSGASGDYSLETVVIGDATILNQTFGVANVSSVTSGLIGVGFSTNEAICPDDPAICNASYPSIVDSLVSQGFINTHAYSLWLDDLGASTGSILFGGIDTSKYKGDLVDLVLIPDEAVSTDAFKYYREFNVVWSNLTVSGVDKFWTKNDTSPALLDSGTSLTYVPPDVYQALSNAFNVTSDGYVPCSLSTTGVTFDFTFGGSDGPTISVDISEFVLDNTGGATFDDGTLACNFGIQPSDTEQCLVGDTFLRSAYVVYDLDNKKVAIAQTNFDAGEPNVIEIVQGVPNVSSTATYLPAAATTGVGSAAPVGPVTATRTVSSPHVTATGTGTATGTSSAPTATYTGAAAAVRAGSTGIVIGCGTVLAALMMMF